MRRVRKAALLVVGVVAGLALLAVGAGLLLPARHSATLTREVEGTPEEVWAVLTDVEGFASWRTDVQRAERVEPIEGWPAWREEGPSGALTFAMTGTAEPPTRLMTRIVDEGLGYGGTWTYELQPSGEGTRVSITENGFVSNPLYRVVSRFLIGYESTLSTYLDALEVRMQREGAQDGVGSVERVGGPG